MSKLPKAVLQDCISEEQKQGNIRKRPMGGIKGSVYVQAFVYCNSIIIYNNSHTTRGLQQFYLR